MRTGRRVRNGALSRQRLGDVAAHSVMSRFGRIGACGDDVVEIRTRTVDGTETRRLSGIVLNRSPEFDVYVEVPRRFARHVRLTGVEGSDLFDEEVQAIGCDHPLRRIVASNLDAFARERDFVPWEP